MNTSYTIQIEKSTSRFDTDEDAAGAAEFLKDFSHFRSFALGLTELLARAGYDGPDDIPSKTKYLYQKMSVIDSGVTKNTVSNWFKGEHPPGTSRQSRKNMYEICFALNLDFKDTAWFLHHVYSCRSFNCHTLEEAVYYYCLKNHVAYSRAREICALAASAPAPARPAGHTMYTQEIRNRLDDIASEEELIEFLSGSRESFQTWNRTASECIRSLLEEIRGCADSKDLIDQMKRRKKFDQMNIGRCGLAMQELFLDAEDLHGKDLSCGRLDPATAYILETLGGDDALSNDFILERILGTAAGAPKKCVIPPVVRTNFPSKKSLSDILKDSDRLESYDAIRKVLVLLKFYDFWCKMKLSRWKQTCPSGETDIPEYSSEELYQIFIDETAALLCDCGYEPLYAGSPYDWIFMCAAHAGDPLSFFRDIVGNFLDDVNR